jgi:hypothetical protein
VDTVIAVCQSSADASALAAHFPFGSSVAGSTVTVSYPPASVSPSSSCYPTAEVARVAGQLIDAGSLTAPVTVYRRSSFETVVTA